MTDALSKERIAEIVANAIYNLKTRRALDDDDSYHVIVKAMATYITSLEAENERFRLPRTTTEEVALLRAENAKLRVELNEYINYARRLAHEK